MKVYILCGGRCLAHAIADDGTLLRSYPTIRSWTAESDLRPFLSDGMEIIHKPYGWTLHELEGEVMAGRLRGIPSGLPGSRMQFWVGAP